MTQDIFPIHFGHQVIYNFVYCRLSFLCCRNPYNSHKLHRFSWSGSKPSRSHRMYPGYFGSSQPLLWLHYRSRGNFSNLEHGSDPTRTNQDFFLPRITNFIAPYDRFQKARQKFIPPPANPENQITVNASELPIISKSSEFLIHKLGLKQHDL